MQRIETLDYFRGVLAVGVMVFHYLAWAAVQVDVTRISAYIAYGVTFFYVLSGASLAYVYRGRIANRSDVGRFYLKRAFRIIPVFWVAVSLYLLSNYVQHQLKGGPLEWDGYRILLNYSLLFSFVDPTAYIPQGGWTIGNEVVFYAICPLLLWAAHRWRYAMPVALLACAVIATWFAFAGFSTGKSLPQQWGIYVNPLNHALFFVGGMAIGLYARRPSAIPDWLVVSVFLTAALVLTFWATPGGAIQAVTGQHRLVFTLASFAAIWALFVYARPLGNISRRIGDFIGAACYSVYLLHPVVAMVVVFAAKQVGIGLGPALVVSAIATLVLGYLSFRYFELPMMQLGKRLGDRWRAAAPVTS